MSLPFVPTMLLGYLNTIQAWTGLHYAIISAGQEVDSRALIDWICVALVREATDQRYILLEKYRTPPLANANLILHLQKLLIQNLPGINPAL